MKDIYILKILISFIYIFLICESWGKTKDVSGISLKIHVSTFIKRVKTHISYEIYKKKFCCNSRTVCFSIILIQYSFQIQVSSSMWLFHPDTGIEQYSVLIHSLTILLFNITCRRCEFS